MIDTDIHHARRGWLVRPRRPGPVLAVALHDGHHLRHSVAALTALTDEQRRREEDPWTSVLTLVGDCRLVVTRSRFEVDLNRPRERAVYMGPGDAWGLTLWKDTPPDGMVSRSLAMYDEFFDMLGVLVDRLVTRHGRVLVLDLHSYNHRRGGPDAQPDPRLNPDVNLGTRILDRQLWGPLVERFTGELRGASGGGELDVRENVKFQGGHLPGWLYQHFPESVCTLSLEFKKTFMDEWTGTLDRRALCGIVGALGSAVMAVRPLLGSG